MSDSDSITVHRKDVQARLDEIDTADFVLGNMGQGPEVIANDDDIARDDIGFTHPNLHRRIDPKEPLEADSILNQEVFPRSYGLNILNVSSIQTTSYNTHDEDSITSEIP